VQSFAFRPSSQCILVSVIPSFFHFVNIFEPGNSPVEVQPEILDIILLKEVYVAYVDWRASFS
jgi:hypothetical protein